MTVQKRTIETREALIEAAIEIFGHNGFHAASNRELADRAGVNSALISYHFGGKTGLYLASFQSIQEQMAVELQPVAEQLRADIAVIHADPVDRNARCLASMEKLLFAMLDMLSQEKASAWAMLILREQQQPTEAFEILYQGIFKNLLEILGTLIALATDGDPKNKTIRLSALTVIGQVLMVRTLRATVMRHMAWKKISTREIREIREQIRATLHARFATRP